MTPAAIENLMFLFWWSLIWTVHSYHSGLAVVGGQNMMAFAQIMDWTVSLYFPAVPFISARNADQNWFCSGQTQKNLSEVLWAYLPI